MKQLFKLTLITLAFWGCTERIKDCTVDLEIDGNYEIVFNAGQKVISTKSYTVFDRKIQTNIKSFDIQKFQFGNEIQRVDSIFNLTVNPNSDSTFRVYKIKSTLKIDSVIYNGTPCLLKNNGINHTVTGHSSHEIAEIINTNDTTNWMVKTVFKSNFHGQTKGKSIDFIAYYLIEKDLSENYIPNILTAIMNKK